MVWNFKQELARKFVHILSVFILLIYFFISDMFSQKIALFILVLILIIFLELEYLRLEIAKKIPLLNKIWKYVRRKKEKDKLGGDVFFLIGGILVLSIFDLKIAIAAILMTTFGDLSAALIGTRFGKHYLRKNLSIEGIFAEFVVDLCIGYIVTQNIFVTLVMAITATFVESIVQKLDDNLMIPIFSGFNGQLTLWILSVL